MVHATTDPSLAQLAQIGLHTQGLYLGAIDGEWGPVSETAFEVYGNYNRYAGAKRLAISLRADQQADLAKFLKNWKDPVSQARYQAVAADANIPVELVAALHWRESGGDFTTYLCNGDPLGRPTTDVPVGILFSDWTAAAVDAIERETAAREQSDLEEGTTDLAAMCVFAEYFNGEGYRERGVPDPYVLAGTAGYAAGKYTSDDVYDPAAVDGQIGVLVMLRAIVPAAS